MKTITLIERITSHSDEEFNLKVNSFIKSHTSAKVIYTSDPNVIFIEYEEQIAETAEDEYTQQGEHHYCGECPYLERSKDGRVKRHSCMIHGKLRRDSAPCCDWYLELLKGEENAFRQKSDLSETGARDGKARAEQVPGRTDSGHRVRCRAW